mmetsp:Transcript_32804/g.71614  ORF Transcript_32804/g.71614 Transcript_32804/m.71614 type:complete len:234 (-) Transcript_32804:49-750(-)
MSQGLGASHDPVEDLLSHHVTSPRWSMGVPRSGSRPTTPGPGSYRSNSGKESPRWAFSRARRDLGNLGHKYWAERPAASTGPGQYSPKTGQTLRRNRVCTMGSSCSPGRPTGTPGPGAYMVEASTAVVKQKPQHSFSGGKRVLWDYSYPSVPSVPNVARSARRGSLRPGPDQYASEGETAASPASPKYSFGMLNRAEDRPCSPGPGAYSPRLAGSPAYSMRGGKRFSFGSKTP